MSEQGPWEGRLLPPRYAGVLLPAVVILPAAALAVLGLWRSDPSNQMVLLLLVPLALLLTARLVMYAVVRRREAGVLIDHRGVTWVATSSTVAWPVVDDLRVTRLARGWAWVGLHGSVGLVDRRHSALHVINLRYVRATTSEVLDAIGQYAPHLVDGSTT